MSTFQEIIHLITDGDDVNAATINQALQQIDGNTRYLRDLFEAALMGSTVFAREVTVESGALLGMPVYYNTTTQQFERALAATAVNGSGELVTADSGQVWGVIHHKHDSTSADILLHGYADLDISAAVDGTVTAGLYHLSGMEAGKMTQQKPPVSIGVLQHDGNGKVYVNPSLSDIFGVHQHYRFDIIPDAAGTPNTPTAPAVHTIPTPDSAVEGWLPAGDAVFNGNAPVGAVFGYNISQSALKDVWPPLPIENAVLEHTRPRNVTYGATTTGTYTTNAVPEDICVIDRNGIWWMTDCYGEVPWHSGDVESTSTLACAPDTSMVLWYSKMQVQTSNTVVTSLRAKTGSGLTVKCAFDTNDDATTGDLELNLDLDLLVDADDDETGHLVIKRFENNTFFRGPVVDAIKAGTGNFTITSTAEAPVGEHRGIVTLNLTDVGVDNEYPIEMIRLSGVTEENYQDVLAVGFPSGKDTEYRAKFKVPANLDAATSVTMAVRFQVLMRVAGDVPALAFTYRVVGRPGVTTGTALALPTTDTAGTLDVSGATAMTLDYYVELQSGGITTNPGDFVLFTLSRAGATDGLAGEVHVIDQRAIVTGIT